MGLFSNLFGGASQGAGAQILQGLQSELNLSQEQIEELKSYFQQFRSEKQDAKAEGNLSEKMDGIKQEFKDHVYSILTDEQKQKFAGLVDKYMGMIKG
jgi:Spy/CpxP family protein refolding chaperone